MNKQEVIDQVADALCRLAKVDREALLPSEDRWVLADAEKVVDEALALVRQLDDTPQWQPIETAPMGYVHPAADFAQFVWLFIPDMGDLVTVGYYCPESKCFRWDGDDGVDDIQPTMWAKIDKPNPPVKGDV